MRSLLLLLFLFSTPALCKEKVDLQKKAVTFIQNYDPAVPGFTYFMDLSFVAAYFVGQPFCVGSTAIIKLIRSKRRMMTNDEALKIAASCLLPFLGGMIVDDYIKHRDRRVSK